VGVMLTGVALASPSGLTATLFYLVHSTLSVAALFLLAGVVAESRGPTGDRLERGRAFAGARSLGLAFLVGTAGAVGLPPLAGFLGKAALLSAAIGAGASAVAIWTVVLVSSLVALFACASAGGKVFWAEARPEPPDAGPVPHLPARLRAP